MRVAARALPVACLVALVACGPEPMYPAGGADAGPANASPPAPAVPDGGSGQGTPADDVIVAHDIHAGSLRASIVRAHDVHAKDATYRSS